jgi:ribonuclease P protein component
MNETAGVREGARLGPRERVRSKNEFAALFRGGRRGGDDVVRVLVGPNGLAWSRIASSVPRRYGNAVKRNRMRRLYRQAFQLEKANVPTGYDILFSPPRGSRAPSLEALRAAIVAQVTRVVRRLERSQAKDANV